MAQEEKTFAPYPKASALRGEETAFQAIVTGEGEHYIEVRTDAPVKVAVYREGYVPCTLSAYPDRFDDDYITTEPSTFPDVLYPVTDGAVNVNGREVLWVSLKVNDDAAGGDYPVEISANGKSEIFRLTVVRSLCRSRSSRSRSGSMATASQRATAWRFTQKSTGHC